MFKRAFVIPFFILILAGCTQCYLMRSEYYDITGKVIPPKPEGAAIDILAQAPDRPYQEIGVVKVMARWGTSKEAINNELKKRARDAGADALIGVQYGEDTSNTLPLCGKLINTKRNISAAAKAIIFTDKK